jgi:hypothetical protein
MICKFLAYPCHGVFWDPQGSVYAFSPVHLALSDYQDTGLGEKKPADRNRAEAPHARNLIHSKEFLVSCFADDGGSSSVHGLFPKEVKSKQIEFYRGYRKSPKSRKPVPVHVLMPQSELTIEAGAYDRCTINRVH